MMILAHYIPDLTDQMLAATLRAAADPARGAESWLLLAETQQVERRLAACYQQAERLEQRLAALCERLGVCLPREQHAA